MQLLALAVEHRMVIVEDDPYGCLRWQGDPIPHLAALAHQVPGARDWVVHLGSFSKIIAPGLRVAWMLAPPAMRKAANQACALMRAMSNPDRLLLLCQLSQGELCVQDLEEALDIRQPTLSQQLGVLRNEGVVSTRRDGRRIYYSVTDPELLQVLGALYATYCPKE